MTTIGVGSSKSSLNVASSSGGSTNTITSGSSAITNGQSNASNDASSSILVSISDLNESNRDQTGKLHSMFSQN